MKKVVVFGAGLVARPHVEYLLEHGFEVTVATRTISKAQSIIGDHKNGHAVAFNIEEDDGTELDELVSRHDLAVSLLPYIYHTKIARSCIKNKKNMATASYVSDEMKSLDAEAKKAGIIILNETGLDPGIDHMSAMRIIHNVVGRGGTIKSFTSFCGGLPAPDANNNPFGYKFSWSPLGVVMAGKNNARFMEDGKIIEIPAKDLFASYRKIHIEPIGDLEGYPNRNSVPYIDLYNIKDTRTMLRGTLRYPGWCSTMKAMGDIGLLDDTKLDTKGMTWAGLMRHLAGCSDGSARDCVAAKLELDHSDPVLDRMEWLGLFSDEALPDGINDPMHLLAHIMDEKMQYAPGERDMIILQHNFEADFPDGMKEHIVSTLIDYGIPNGDSSMARTVGLPLAIGVRLILEGEINVKGVHIPILPEIYNPILNELERLGIKFEETYEKVE